LTTGLLDAGPIVQGARVPGDFFRGMAQEIHRVELFPQAFVHRVGEREIAQQAQRLLLALLDQPLADRYLAAGEQGRQVLRKSCSRSCPFQVFQTFGLVPRMSATVNR
jgi:hypothetical protein